VEKNVYRALSSHRFLPTCHGFGEAEQTEQFPFLVLEDLSGAHWPPPWTPHQIDAVLETLSDIHRVRDAFVETLLPVEVAEAQTRTWDAVAADPAPFLSLHFCSETWLAAALPTLLSAATAVPLSGDSLLHLDVRSDNICHRPEDDRAVFVDWNWVCRGNPDLDIAAWLPSLQNEGGPLPETILPDAAELAAWLSGFWAAQAGMPPLPTAPRVRAVQKQQLRTALPWAARALSLPPLDTPL
jgi:Ser/Thr protein kinase RdoA (MazF antagonist)